MRRCFRCATPNWCITALWFTPQREALDAYFTEAQQRVTGTVGLQLYKGNVTVTQRKSPYSLYRKGLASFTMTGYNPKDAEGFINLFALPVTIPRGSAKYEVNASAKPQATGQAAAGQVVGRAV